MIRFRPFRNNDVPALVQVWSSQPAFRGLAQPITTSILDRYVFSKLYFDRHGLIVAEEDNELIGFVHAGFGPNADRSWAGTDSGVLSMLLVSAAYRDRETVARQLVEHAEDYLKQRGTRVLIGGEFYPYSPFYFGLYGGSQLPGVLGSDHWRADLFTQAGYRCGQRFVVLHCPLAEFRPVINRQQMTVRRRTRLEMMVDPRATTWWDANLASQHDFTSFRLLGSDTQSLWASATFWDMEPLASSWGIHAAGLMNFERTNHCSEQGAELFLLSEALKHLQSNGVTLVETQVPEDDAGRLKLISELGFRAVDAGVVYVKE